MSRSVPVAALAGVAYGWWTRQHRRSAAVRSWAPGGGERHRAGALSVRTLGSGDRAVVLLHGITASGDVFGADYDDLAEGQRVAIPDLLGFGGSLDERRSDFSVTAHLAALDEMHRALRLDGLPLVVVGHSLGALLGLAWAAHRPETEHVVAFCAPLYDSADEADEQLQNMGWLERVFALEGQASARACALMCHHRWLAQWLTVALEPRWPIAVARRGVLHTWPAYLGAMNGVIRAPMYLAALARLEERGIRVTLVEGSEDPVPVPGRAAALGSAYANVEVLVRDGAGHDLPIEDSAWAAALLGGLH